MRTKLMIGSIILVFLIVALPRIPLGAAATISPKKQGSEDRWYGGIIFINGRYTSMEREFGPIPFCVLLNCKENRTRVTGINIEYDGWYNQFSFSRISETDFNKITLAGYYLGFCRLNTRHCIQCLDLGVAFTGTELQALLEMIRPKQLKPTSEFPEYS
jgi:hypothetical protein